MGDRADKYAELQRRVAELRLPVYGKIDTATGSSLPSPPTRSLCCAASAAV
jgi:hypothetical protein